MKDILKRKGIVKINRSLIKDDPEDAIKILKEILIVDVKDDYMSNTLIYEGYSKHFDLLEEGLIIPSYIAIIDNNKKVVFKREKEYTENDVKGMLEEILKTLENKI